MPTDKGHTAPFIKGVADQGGAGDRLVDPADPGRAESPLSRFSLLPYISRTPYSTILLSSNYQFTNTLPLKLALLFEIDTKQLNMKMLLAHLFALACTAHVAMAGVWKHSFILSTCKSFPLSSPHSIGSDFTRSRRRT
jgi:hypothetical protein